MKTSSSRHVFLLAVLTSAAVIVYSLAESATQQRQFLRSPAMAELDLPFSDAVLHGDTLYISGAGGIDISTMTAPEDPRDEVRLLMENLQATLALADMTLDDLVTVTIFCPDLALYKDFNAVYRSYFDGDFPARAFIGSGPLLFGMRFEIQGIAVR